MRLIVRQHRRKTADSTCRQSIDRTRTDCVDPDLFRTQIIREIADACLQRRLRHTHHIVVGHHLRRPVVTHRHNTAPRRHQRGSRPTHSHQRVGADIMSHPEGLPRGVHKVSFQRLLGSKSHAMQKKIHLCRLALHEIKKLCDVFIPTYITRCHWSLRPKRRRQLLDILLQPFPLVIEDQLGPCICPCLGNPPGNAPFVSDTKNQTNFSFQRFVTHAV